MIKLKETLRERRLAIYGTEIKLIKRLSENDLKVWDELAARRRGISDMTHDRLIEFRGLIGGIG